MSKINVKLCNHILTEHYGDFVANVGTLLLGKGAMPLGLIVALSKDKMKGNQVKKCLTILIHHNLCTFERTSKGIVEYSLNSETVLSCLRFPRYIYAAKSQHDAAAELIVEELLQQGRSLLNDLVTKVMERVNESLETQGGAAKINEDSVLEKFKMLVKQQYIKRCSLPLRNNDNKVVSVPVNNEVQFLLPTPQECIQGKRKHSGDDSDQPKKKMKISESGEKASGENVYWQVNFARFHLHFRNRAFVSAVTRRVDAKAGEIVSTMLRLCNERTDAYAPTTCPVSIYEIKQGLGKDTTITKTLLDQYLKILIDDSSEIVVKVEESGGGMYSINILKGLRSLCKAHIESMIQEKYGSKCLRIFRILLTKHHVEQNQIEKCAMINIKESKEMLYRLYSDGLVNATELCKTPDHAPARTTFLFTVDESYIARQMVERCYKALYNSITRRNHELNENKRLLDKQQRVEAIIVSLGTAEGVEEQRAELEELISPTEKAQITKVTNDVKRLEQCELQIDDTLFTLTQYLDYQSVSKKSFIKKDKKKLLI